MKDSFIVYGENYENIADLTDEQAGKLFKALFRYSAGEDTQIDDQSTRIIFRTMKNQMNRCNDKYEAIRKKRSEAGKKGTEKRWNDNKAITNDNTVITNDNNVITNDNKALQGDNKNNLPVPVPVPVPVPDNNNINMSSKLDPPYKEIIDYLNEKTGKGFRCTSKETKRVINARFRDGYTLDDFKKVIDNKVAAWGGDPKMDEYLRPATLFSTKFEGYLNEKPVSKKQDGKPANRFCNFEQRDYDFAELERQLIGG